VTPLFALLFDSLDERLRLRRPGRQALTKVFPHHWTFLFGEVALFSFVILVLTGIFLTMFYVPSVEPVTYPGSMELYQGQELPAAFESIVRLSHDVPGGLLFRRIHRGAAYVFMTAIVLHLLRVLLTGAFRRPREVNYHVGLLLLLLGLGLVGTGQALPYDVVEGAALRIAYSFMLAIPFIGEQVAFWVFGGDFFGDAIPRFFIAHVLILPGIFALLVTAHLVILVRQRHAQFPHPRIDGQRFVVGQPLWPTQFISSTATLLAMGGVIALFSVFVPWSDFSLHGPAAAGVTSSTNHPDWWLSWTEGALVLYPDWEFYPIPGVVISAPFVAGFLLPLVVFGPLFAFPWIDRRLAPYEGDVHVLQRPYDVPARAGLVFSGLSFIIMLTVASHVDYLSLFLGVRVETLVGFFQVTVLLVPALVFVLVYLRARAYNRRMQSL
jgi:ubiquinol-cytochrome c reductase cytochrome b subunit